MDHISETGNLTSNACPVGGGNILRKCQLDEVW